MFRAWRSGIGVVVVGVTVIHQAWAREERHEAPSPARRIGAEFSPSPVQPDSFTSSAQTSTAVVDPGAQPFHALDSDTPPAASESSEGPATFELKTLSSEAEALQLCETFLQAIVAGEHGRAFDAVRPYFPVTDDRFLKLKSAISDQLDVAGQHLGRPLGYTFLDSALVGRLLLRYRFAQQFPVDVFYWQVLFYRAPQGWIINQLGFDDETERLFRDQ